MKLRICSCLAYVPCECLSAKICCSWSSKKFAKRATCEFFLALFLLLVGSGPKRSKPIEKLGRSLLVSSTALQLNRTATLQPGKKKCPCLLIYVWACVNKDFVHRTSIGQARALCYNKQWNGANIIRFSGKRRARLNGIFRQRALLFS